MDAFRLRDAVIGNYESYIASFLTVLDPRIRRFIDTRLAAGDLWPDPLMQLSPAYVRDETVGTLVERGLLDPFCGRLFQDRGKSIRLHRHQRDALDLAAEGHNYVVTTGTGSGKSLTYILPIFNHILRHRPHEGKVRAIIVYPMNALINSQQKALDRYVANLKSEACPIRYARYTGQESLAEKQAIRDNPPHILLTNYVMLELMLTRPEEHRFVEAAHNALQFLVLDELHTYRGRQGADVAMLVRRLRERAANPTMQCIGTSATMSSGGSRQERAAAIASVASTLFGVRVAAEHVVDETLQRAFADSPAANGVTLHTALTNLQQPVPSSWEALAAHPLAQWIERTFGPEMDGGDLRRRQPLTLNEGAQRLADETGLDARMCAQRLRAFFTQGSTLRSPDDVSGFAFKLHQFVAQGGSVYATLEPPDTRYLTLDGQHYAPSDPDKVLFPLVFCRVCGQDYYLCSLNERSGYITPREASGADETRDGYVLVDTEGLWSEDGDELLPSNWFKELKRGREIKPEYAQFRPRKVRLTPDGALSDDGNTITGWYTPVPFLSCLRCGEVYTKRQVSDFGKLARLSSEGRSTATTLLTLATLAELRQESDLADSARKLLSFTDNRQDASLQAGHFNDFVEVALLRAAIYRALAAAPDGLDHLTIAQKTVAALGLDESVYAREPATVSVGPAARRNRTALQALVEYRVYEDLRRGWRVNQPNLEQCGLLRVGYDSLADVCAEESAWGTHPILAAAAPQTRLNVMTALLDYMRRELAIDAACLEREKQPELVKQVNAALREGWAFDENEYMYTSTLFVLPGTESSKKSGVLGC